MYRNKKLFVMLLIVLALLAGVLVYAAVTGGNQEDMRGTLVKIHCPVRMRSRA